MSIILRGAECCCYPSRGGCACPQILRLRPNPPKPYCEPCLTLPSNKPPTRPCCFDLPCKAHCYEHDGFARPSGRYCRSVVYPGNSRLCAPCCPAPIPPFHPCCVYTCNKLV